MLTHTIAHVQDLIKSSLCLLTVPEPNQLTESLLLNLVTSIVRTDQPSIVTNVDIKTPDE